MAVEVEDWVADLYRAIDRGDADAVLAFYADDIVLTFGNAPAVVGKDQVRAGHGSWDGVVEGMRHTFRSAVTAGDTTVLEADVEYRLVGRPSVTVPVATFLRRKGDHVAELRIYADLGPVFGGGAGGEG